MSQIKLTADSGGGTTSLKAPSSTTSNADVVLKLPVADGSANQVLKTDGSGQLSFTSNAGTTINNNADNRVITGSGTANTLNAEGNVTFDGQTFKVDNTSANPQFHLTSAANGLCELKFGDANDTTRGNIIYRNGTAGDALCFNGYNNTERMRIDSSGNVGIGTTSPSNLLTLTHSANASDGLIVKNTNNSQGSAVAIVSIRGGDNASGRLEIECNGQNHNLIEDSLGNLTIEDNGTERMRIRAGGGLTFNGDTAAANALDDYEEGTFTPALGGDGNHSTYHVDGSGWYTKVGRKVDIHLTIDNKDLNNSASGTVMITGLPFVSNSSMNPIATTDLYCYNVDFNTNRIQSFYLTSDETRIFGIESVADGAWVSWPVSDWNDGGMYLRLHLVYYV